MQDARRQGRPTTEAFSEIGDVQILSRVCSELLNSKTSDFSTPCVAAVVSGIVLARGRGMVFRRWNGVVFLIACAACVSWASLSLTAEPEAPALCCGSPGDCGESYKCCNTAAMGLPPCDDLQGMCLLQCIRPSV